MSELYISLVIMFGKVQVDNICQNLYWTPYSNNERVIEACEVVWKETYIYKK